MNELVTRIGKEPKETITSLELLELINKFRIEDGNKTKLEHKDLLKAIRNEFRKQIGEGKISPTSYKDNWNRNQPKFDLTLKQALRLLTKESVEVREKVFDYIEKQLFYKDIYGKCKALGYQLMQFMKLDMPNIYKINENQKQLGLM